MSNQLKLNKKNLVITMGLLHRNKKFLTLTHSLTEANIEEVQIGEEPTTCGFIEFRILMDDGNCYFASLTKEAVDYHAEIYLTKLEKLFILNQGEK